MDPRWQLRSFLRTIREVWPTEQTETLGLAYRGPADFVLQHGRWWKPTPWPPQARRGKERACYGNSIGGAVVLGLAYVEGWALPPAGDLAIPHAWNGDERGGAIDLTWPKPGLAYLGVAFSVERADDATWAGDACVLDDWQRGWPLLRERWHGEQEPDPAWRPSPALLAARAGARGDVAEMHRQFQVADQEIAREASR